jgi:hypothetical protein
MAFEGEDARRWALVDAPALMPGVDFVTRSPNGPFIDTGISVSIENRGRVYLSVQTIKEMAEIAGLIDTKNAQERSLYDMEKYNEGFKAGLQEGTDLNDRLGNIISHIAAGAAVSRPSVDDVAAEPAKEGRPSKN